MEPMGARRAARGVASNSRTGLGSGLVCNRWVLAVRRGAGASGNSRTGMPSSLHSQGMAALRAAASMLRDTPAPRLRLCGNPGCLEDRAHQPLPCRQTLNRAAVEGTLSRLGFSWSRLERHLEGRRPSLSLTVEGTVTLRPRNKRGLRRLGIRRVDGRCASRTSAARSARAAVAAAAQTHGAPRCARRTGSAHRASV